MCMHKTVYIQDHVHLILQMAKMNYNLVKTADASLWSHRRVSIFLYYSTQCTANYRTKVTSIIIRHHFQHQEHLKANFQLAATTDL